MLPAKGLFRSICCPFYEQDMCKRPYCQFKHSKPEIQIPKTVSYSATPKVLLQQVRENNEQKHEESSKKKPRLEYIPMPSIITASSRAVYIPSAKKDVETPPVEEKAEAVVEEEAVNDDPDDDIWEPLELESETIETEAKSSITDDKKEKIVEKEKTEKVIEQSSSNLSSSSSNKDKEKDKSNREKQTSRSEKDKDRHRQKEKEKEKERKEKEKHKVREKDKDKSSRSSEKSDKIRDKDKSKHSSSSKDKDRRHSSSDNKDKKSSSKSHSSSSSSHRKSSSSSSRHSSSSSKEPSKISKEDKKAKDEKIAKKLEEEIYKDLILNPPSDIEFEDDDEDDIIKQCMEIFEEFETTDVPKKTEKEDEKKKSTNGRLSDLFEEKEYEDPSKKKRLAHDGGTKPVVETPVAAPRVNHVRNAMHSVYIRQEIMRKRNEEMALRKLEEEKEAAERQKRIEQEEVKRKSLLISPQSGQEIKKNGISSSNFYQKSPNATISPVLPRSRISPVANVLAIQRAKERIEAIKLARTPSMTASKVTGRMAHMNTKMLVAAPEKVLERPAPPVLEATSTKISYNIRMQYYNMMVKHCLTIYTTCEDAWDRAQTEELAVFKKCTTPMIYKSSALLTVNKLRKEAMDSGSTNVERNKTISHDVILAGRKAQKTSWSVNKKIKTDEKVSPYTIDTVSSTGAYKMIYECILTEELLQSNGYPRPGDGPGKAKMYTPKPSKPPKEDERYCSRCAKIFNLEVYEENIVDSCIYHAKGTGYRRGFADNLHRCCQQPAGTPGCCYGNYHVTGYSDYDNLTGYVTTIDPPEDYNPSKKDVFALDCEMCYTTRGFELARITVVDINEKVVYDSLVKPDNEIVDCNTTYSGITEQMLSKTTTTLRNVQAVLLSMFNSQSILIGHSLESDLKALKIIHSVVVDTSVLFPHKMGPPKKRALKTLCIENLKKIIQENEAGHDSAEDAIVCIELVKHYLRNRIV